MKPDKNGFDELQKARRDRIGHQTLNLLLYLILIDVVLYSFGVRWLSYPANTMVILAISSSIYAIRIIAGNALLPAAGAGNRKKSVKGLILGIAATILVAVGMVFLFSKLNVLPAAHESGDNSALVLFVLAATGLTACAVAATINKIRDSRSSEND